MKADSPASPLIQHTLSIRVRYPEVDAMGYLHHSRFLQYFEMGRIELLRDRGHSYGDLERDGIFFVVVKAECRYKAPAKYDDEIQLTTRIVRMTQVRLDHAYEMRIVSFASTGTRESLAVARPFQRTRSWRHLRPAGYPRASTHRCDRSERRSAGQCG